MTQIDLDTSGQAPLKITNEPKDRASLDYTVSTGAGRGYQPNDIIPSREHNFLFRLITLLVHTLQKIGFGLPINLGNTTPSGSSTTTAIPIPKGALFSQFVEPVSPSTVGETKFFAASQGYAAGQTNMDTKLQPYNLTSNTTSLLQPQAVMPIDFYRCVQYFNEIPTSYKGDVVHVKGIGHMEWIPNQEFTNTYVDLGDNIHPTAEQSVYNPNLFRSDIQSYITSASPWLSVKFDFLAGGFYANPNAGRLYYDVPPTGDVNANPRGLPLLGQNIQLDVLANNYKYAGLIYQLCKRKAIAAVRHQVNVHTDIAIDGKWLIEERPPASTPGTSTTGNTFPEISFYDAGLMFLAMNPSRQAPKHLNISQNPVQANATNFSGALVSNITNVSLQNRIKVPYMAGTFLRNFENIRNVAVNTALCDRYGRHIGQVYEDTTRAPFRQPCAITSTRDNYESQYSFIDSSGYHPWHPKARIQGFAVIDGASYNNTNARIESINSPTGSDTNSGYAEGALKFSLINSPPVDVIPQGSAYASPEVYGTRIKEDIFGAEDHSGQRKWRDINRKELKYRTYPRTVTSSDAFNYYKSGQHTSSSISIFEKSVISITPGDYETAPFNCPLVLYMEL